jgi:ATP-binding cassette subfamily B multidrug efflux pump
MMHGGGIQGSHWNTIQGGGATLDSLQDDGALGKAYDHGIVVRLLAFIKPFKASAIASLLAVITYTAATMAIPFIIKIAIDDYVIPFADSGDIPAGLSWLGLLFLLTTVIHFIANYAQFQGMAWVSQGILYSLRTQMFNHLQSLSPSFYHRTQVGRIMSRVQNDVLQLQETFSLVILTAADLMSLLGIVGIMLYLDLKLAVFALSVIPVLFVIMATWQHFAKASFIRIRRAIAMVNGALNENITGVRVVQSFNRQHLNMNRFQSLNQEHLDANVQASRLSGILQPLVELLTGTAMAVVVIMGGFLVLDGNLEIGVLVAFALYIQRFFDPIRNLTMQYTQLQRSMASGARIFELLEVKPEVIDQDGAPEMPPIQGEIRYERINFGYLPNLEVLKEIDLHILPGETVALVGPTGAGKTTLASLLLRSYDVTSGRITIDGHDIREVQRESLVNQMSMVLQDPFLFSGTVKDNIRYNHTNATDEEIEAAARAVDAHGFIMKMEHGYDSMLQERGGNLSLGQRQLICFARALAANPKVLILDEATANVDASTELLIQRAMRNMQEGRTAIIIAHRLSTIRNADKIVVVDDGRIVEIGKHQDLLDNGGRYARLHALNYSAQEVTVSLDTPQTQATD